ncbi:replication initiation protein [Corynebacterium poyangense]|uniref:replication initiation protein n=1 Tax=Corynebacterium poyangense TaxID=2684405 RepID=UPI0021E288DD|nr:replication initiation protein [Corynebacterium poyangense]
MSGKAQALWLIDPAYANPAVGDSRHMRLLAATTQALGEYLGYDPHFFMVLAVPRFMRGKIQRLIVGTVSINA